MLRGEETADLDRVHTDCGIPRYENTLSSCDQGMEYGNLVVSIPCEALVLVSQEIHTRHVPYPDSAHLSEQRIRLEEQHQQHRSLLGM